ncbi:MAG: phosphoenolpyruvate carboxylase, partial [Candidatus Obscuribacterales bacterium]|nr:phosphoenolpyruvate carboxylase [Candidatus Obscuribacterales bacterium]
MTGVKTDNQLSKRNKPLRDDVRSLGFMLGETIARLEGEETFKLVEEIRSLSKSLHRPGESKQSDIDESQRKLAELTAKVDLETARKLIKAFLIYFDLINMAEQNHRLRRRAQKEYDTIDSFQRGSLEALFKKIDVDELQAEDLHKTIANLDIQVVFTAHPTEITRRTVLVKQLEMARQLYLKDHPPLTYKERQQIDQTLKSVVESLWLSDHIIYFKPDVLDEVKYGLY